MVKKANFAANFADGGGTLLRPYNKFEEGGQVPPENDGDKYDIGGNELEPGGVVAPENMSDVSDAIGFVQNYYTSPGYLRRLGDAGLPQDKLLIAPYVKYDYFAPIYRSESNVGLGTMTIGVQNESGDIEIEEKFEATDRRAAQGKHDDRAYNESRSSWRRGTTHDLRDVIKKREYERYVNRAVDSLSTRR